MIRLFVVDADAAGSPDVLAVLCYKVEFIFIWGKLYGLILDYTYNNMLFMEYLLKCYFSARI